MRSSASKTSAIDRVASRLIEHLFTSIPFFESALSSISFWCVICLACAGVLAWDNRHFMNPDGLSYLDLASEALRGGPAKLLNGYWSPGYPALISIALLIFHPHPSHEFPLIHLVNFVIFALAL